EAVVVEVLGDYEALREAHEHAFEAFWIIRGREWHRDIGRCHAAGTTAHDVRRQHCGSVAVRAIDSGLVEALTGETGHAHNLADTHKGGAAGEHKDAIGRGSVAVACRILKKEALLAAIAFKVTDNNALRRNRAGDGGRQTAALDLVDGRKRQSA